MGKDVEKENSWFHIQYIELYHDLKKILTIHTIPFKSVVLLTI